MAPVPGGSQGSKGAGGWEGLFLGVARRQTPPWPSGLNIAESPESRNPGCKTRRKNMATYSDVIEYLVQAIVGEVRPLRIIVFGSGARDEMGPDSDIDMLVVMPDGTHRRRTAQLLYRNVRGAGVPFDVLVATPGDLEKHKDNIGLIYRTILREGKEVYAARR